MEREMLGEGEWKNEEGREENVRGHLLHKW